MISANEYNQHNEGDNPCERVGLDAMFSCQAWHFSVERLCRDHNELKLGVLEISSHAMIYNDNPGRIKIELQPFEWQSLPEVLRTAANLVEKAGEL